MDLSRPVVVQRHSYLPICHIWDCPWAKNLSNEAALGLDFVEPISLKLLDGFIPFWVLWNCLDLLCNIMVIWPWPWIFKVNIWKSGISGMGWLIDMEGKGCESIGCYTHFETFNVHFTHDLDLGFLRSNFENAVSQEWEGRLTWNERDLSWQNVGPMLWRSMFTSSMTLTLDFQGQILKKSYLRNGMADWHGTKGMWVDRILDSHCDFKIWPHPWPWSWIFKVKYWNGCNLGMGGSTHLKWKGCELDMMLDAQWDSHWAMVHGK